MKKNLLANKFISELKGNELWPPFHNASIFTQATGWNTNKYFQKYYKDKSSFPLFVNAKGKECIMYFPISKAQKLSKEIFTSYWKHPEKLRKIEKEYNILEKNIDKIYNQLTYKYIKRNKYKQLYPYIKKNLNDTWYLSALVFFTIWFEKEFCLELLDNLNIKIAPVRLEKILSKAVALLEDSFEQRRLLYFLKLISRDKNWDSVVESCQYFYANFNNICNLIEVEKNLKKDFKIFTSAKAKSELKKINNEKNNKIKKYNTWYKSLNLSEKKLVNYLHTIIKIRDKKKDIFAKMMAIAFRVSEKIFQQLHISKKYILYYGIDELLNGEKYLNKTKKDLMRRYSGYSVLVHYNNKREIEYGKYYKNKRILEKYFIVKVSQKLQTKEIIGQIGSPGKAIGRIRIIKNIGVEGKKFKNGEVLVTGMTRPEFTPIMKKAKAIITDEGGLTCHAAIVSRELGIPCIIGTKIATRVLKDGNLVEVDANHGVVKILKPIQRIGLRIIKKESMNNLASSDRVKI